MDFLSSGMLCIYFPICAMFSWVPCINSLWRYNLNLGWSRLITSAYGMHFRCKQQDFVTHESIARNGIFGGGGGGFLQQDQRNDWCVIFPSESALNYCNAHMLPSAGSRYSAQSADPRAVFWEEYW